ncbi:MAG: Uma2 family endonuclease [Gomphosphaeria aponina SAG 52.96 = DSM 107014]|uniref:Uma2 family endonuclease n=1 Tax=Gomphosphaeria aponina SAG 52.96 = DSM 107014 TaxID=1521640 RepID=A0A941GRI3_9CHRO|nr:Uma2 family endonuclease [Gomphosphaeria aponina SAG 52.96 = DSM 107014]
MKVLAKWTVEDYHRMIDAGILSDRSLELLEGEIVTMSPESPLDSDTTETLAGYLRKKLTEKAKVREAHPITLLESEPEPDLAIVKQKRYIAKRGIVLTLSKSKT